MVFHVKKEMKRMEKRSVYAGGGAGVIGGLLPVFCYAAIVVADPDIMG